MLKAFNIVFDNGAVVLPHTSILVFSGFSNMTFAYSSVLLASGQLSAVTSETIPPRAIAISAEIPLDYSERYATHFSLQSFHKIEVNGKYIIGKCQYVNIKDNYRTKPILELDFICFDPWFYRSDGFLKNLAGKITLFGMPWLSTIANGVSLGYNSFPEQVSLYNDGVGSVGGIFTLTAARDVVKNPTVTNITTGKYIRYNLEMNPGDVLIISTLAGIGNKFALLNGVSVTDKRDRLSEYWEFPQGDNIMGYDADLNRTALDIVVEMHPKYSMAINFERLK